MIPHDEAPEHEFEAVRGLPQALPPGERLHLAVLPIERFF